MRAWILHDIGDLRYEEVNEPGLADLEVLVSVRAAGICGSDIPRAYKIGAHRMPIVLGHEFSGEVVKVGKKVSADWMGKRVGIFPLIPCRKCSLCKMGKYEMCRQYSYLGSRCDGGFAEYVAVPVWNLIELPQKVSFEEAAMLEPMGVAVHAIRRIMPQQDDFVAVCGLGTIGLLLVMFLREAGVKNILAAGNKEYQRQQIVKLGIPEENYCDSNAADFNKWIRERTMNKGADIFFECVGKNETVVKAIENTAPAGKVMLVGNPYSDMLLNRDVYWRILRNQLIVTGTWNSSFTHEADDDWNYVLKKLETDRISPADFISHRFSLEDFEKGFHIMRDKTEDYVKIMGIVE